MRYSLLALAALLSACSGARQGPRAMWVEAEGWASADAPQARVRALADAQRRAAEKASGVSVTAVTAVDQSARVLQQVRAEARGEVRRFETVNERVEDGFLKVRIKAWVAAPKDSPEEAQAPSLPWPSGAAPRVALLVTGVGGRALEAVARGFAVEGFPPLSAGEPADLLLRGTAVAEALPDERLTPMISFRARLTVTAADAKSGAVIWTGTFEEAALGTSAASARETALDLAGGALSRAAAAQWPGILWKRL